MPSPHDSSALALDRSAAPSFGARIRRLFGPYERQVAEVYRALYFDLDALADTALELAPQARRILEVGCGEGALTQRLAERFTNAQITAIDITPRLGRLFAADASRVEFLHTSVGALADRRPAAFDLVVMADVLHHVPLDERLDLLHDIKRTVAPQAIFILKDWARSRTPIHWLCHASDRYLTGDDVDFCSPAQARALLGEAFGAERVRELGTFRPWKNNICFCASP